MLLLMNLRHCVKMKRATGEQQWSLEVHPRAQFWFSGQTSVFLRNGWSQLQRSSWTVGLFPHPHIPYPHCSKIHPEVRTLHHATILPVPNSVISYQTKEKACFCSYMCYIINFLPTATERASRGLNYITPHSFSNFPKDSFHSLQKSNFWVKHIAEPHPSSRERDHWRETESCRALVVIH